MPQVFVLPPKKKLSKKEKARLEAEQAEMLRLEMEREKLKKLEEARQRRKVEREEAKRRLQLEIQENKQRRAQLKNSMAFFHQIRECTDAIKMASKNQNDWEKFMRCNGLPNSNSPSDLRKYIHQWQIDIERRNRESRNWLLKTNERTLLTQDINIPDLTKATLRKQQGNLGDVYAQRVKEILGILLELEEVLGDKQKPAHTLTDLSKLKTEIRVLLKDYLDDFTHKIMSHIERDMEIDRPGVSKHIYESEVFKSFIWTFSKDAQISLCAKPRIGEQHLHNEIDFPLIEMQISLPPTVSLYSSALRGLWLNYDHFSDYCPSFKLKKPRPDYINMLTQTKKEWRKRKEILQNMLDECSKEVPLTELEQFEHERDLTSQQAREKSLDVDKLYLEYEDELNKLRRRAIGPEGFGLTDTDVNLRKYRIIGGVYCTDYLETPQQDKQLNARSFIRTIFAPNKLLHKNYYQTFKPPPPPQPGVRRLPEEIEAEMRMVEAALDKLALVTVQLPDSVIWFEPPIACRWETQIETLESDLTEGIKQPINSNSGNTTDVTPLSTTTNLSPLKSLSPRFPASKLRKKSSQKSSGSNLPVREVNDFDMFQMPSEIDIYSLLKDFIAPRLPQGFSVRIDGSRMKQLQQHKQKKGKKKQKQTKVLFLARPKTTINSPETEGPAQISLKVKQDLQKIHKTRITEDFLDFDEPKEFFPCVQFEKLLKIKPLDKVNEQHDVKLDLKNRNSDDAQDNVEKLKSFSRDDSKGSLVSVTSYKSSKSATSGDSVSRCSSEMTNKKEVTRTYMFSQLIEDLDRLCDLQTPVQQEELLQQISEILMGKNNTTAASTFSGKDVTCDVGADETEAAGDEGETKPTTAAVSTLTDVMQQPAAFGYYSGISFVREAETLREEDEEEEEGNAEDDDQTSTDEEEYDDDDYDEYFLNENLDNEAALTSYRSEASGGTSGVTAVAATASSGKETGIHDFLNKHSHSDTNSSGDGKKAKLLNESTFTQGKWSTRDVHDTKFNEDKLSIQFRTGRMGIFGFALNRYSNMPYQTWEIKPDLKCPENILFSFTASLVSLDITITSQGFCVNNFQGGSTTAINEMIGKTLSLDAIKQILISSAVDIFPEEDAFCYTEGSCEKNYVMEMHLYACMSTLALSHNFSWSRWNLLAGSRTAVLLLRELVDGKKMPNHSTLLVTPLKTAIIDCTEVSASFNSQGIAGMEYYADLYQLAQVHAQPSSLDKQRNMNPVLRDNVATILMAIRPLSFC
ncbi:hypothetical protein FF38_04905 [Lucilia cuprina]|uniref:Axonemal 84 kDa protein n=1 Tax=Lucilia cuprina TaxID=7375 RepID=A0A0L0C8R9_LUCCU|nr:hypothetical protein FF38_04905 [Lucilia cuprina]